MVASLHLRRLGYRLPMLLGMAVTFALVATIAAVGGGWAVHANEYGRTIAIAVLAVLGLTLLFPSFADRLMRPLVAVGARLSQSADQASDGSVFAPLLLGQPSWEMWGRRLPQAQVSPQARAARQTYAWQRTTPCWLDRIAGCAM